MKWIAPLLLALLPAKAYCLGTSVIWSNLGSSSTINGTTVGGDLSGTLPNPTVKSSAGNFSVSGNVSINTLYGQVSGNGSSTMTPCGLLFFIDSATIQGSTFTLSATASAFSTFTLTANSIVNWGEGFNVECGFSTNGTAPTGPHMSVYVNGIAAANENAYVTSVSANTRYRIRATERYISGLTFLVNTENMVCSDAGTCTPTLSYTSATTGLTVSLDKTQNIPIYCGGVGTTGPTNFDYMAVSKLCR